MGTGDTSVGYVGWIGNNNLGDEAIYSAISKTTTSLSLKPSRYATESSITLLGGGTILPGVYGDPTLHIQNRDLNVALGVGVTEPDFENQRRAPVDLRWAAGRLGINLPAVLYKTGFAGTVTQYVGNQLPGVKVSGVYCHDEHFRRAGETLDIVTVRGPQSKQVLERYGISSQIVGDTALLHEPNEYYSDAAEKIVITLKTPGVGRKWTNSRDYITQILQFCQSLPNGVEKVFLPFRPLDIPLHSNLATQVTNARWEDYTSVVNIDGALNEIASAEVVFGERLHASIFAACCYTPFVSLGYAPKNEDFADSVDMSELNVRIDDVDVSVLSDIFETAKSYDANEIRPKVNEYRNRLKNTLRKVENGI